MSEDQQGRMEKEQLARRRLLRLLDALPVFSGFSTPDGHLLQTRPPTQESFIWSLPAFAHEDTSVTQIVELCEAAANGTRVQVELPYKRGLIAPSPSMAVSLAGKSTDSDPAVDDTAGDLGRGLLTLSPIFDDDGFVAELGITLIDCDDNGLSERSERAPTRLAEANRRIESVLDLSSRVVEALAAPGRVEPRDVATRRRTAIAEKLDVLARTIEVLSELDRESVPLETILSIALQDGPGKGASTMSDRMDVDLGGAVVPISHAPVLALLLSELAINARRVGALSAAVLEGRVIVEAEVLDSMSGRSLRLHWIEEGQDREPSGADDPAETTVREFGLIVAESLFPDFTDGSAHGLETPDGTSWTFHLPLDDGPASEPGSDGGFDGGFLGDDFPSGSGPGGRAA